MFEKRVLVVNRPDFETATHYGSYWTNELLVKVAREKGIPVVDLYGSNAVRESWEREIRTKNAILVGGCGHGNATQYTGQGYDLLLNSEDSFDLALMKGRFGSFLSCQFGRSAQKFVEAGMRGFFGYTEDFWFVAAAYPNSYASQFFNSHYSLDQAWTSGKKNGGAYTSADAEWIRAIANSDEVTRRYLIFDHDHMTMKGDPEDGPYITPEEPKFPCPWGDFKTDDVEVLKSHILDVHCPVCPPQPQRPLWCQWFGDLVSCPISK